VPGWAYYRTTGQQPLYVRLGDASGRRHHGANGRIASQVILKEWKKAAN